MRPVCASVCTSGPSRATVTTFISCHPRRDATGCHQDAIDFHGECCGRGRPLLLYSGPGRCPLRCPRDRGLCRRLGDRAQVFSRPPHGFGAHSHSDRLLDLLGGLLKGGLHRTAARATTRAKPGESTAAPRPITTSTGTTLCPQPGHHA